MSEEADDDIRQGDPDHPKAPDCADQARTESASRRSDVDRLVAKLEALGLACSSPLLLVLGHDKLTAKRKGCFFSDRYNSGENRRAGGTQLLLDQDDQRIAVQAGDRPSRIDAWASR